ncbi:MAG: T9SS type A sorting domain-containing protein, partial [Bacteroidia bacterium]|nr:T9SS type A sorting domain-containing protein [Bacteroidia bacterium]
KVNKYAFVDDAPYQQTYYRLKQVDYDGKFEYSKIVYLERGNQTPLQNNILVYPNPTKNTLSVDVSLIGNESVEIAVFDAKGSLVYKGNKQMEKGLNQTVLDVNSYTKGLYLIKISGLNSGYYSSTSFIKE